jgi:hypothetical protein
MKPNFLLRHIQILNNATNTANLIIMHNIFMIIQGSIFGNSVHEFCLALKVDCMAYEKNGHN